MGRFLELRIGSASKLENDQVESELKDLLAHSEKEEHAYKLIRDQIVFTDKPLLLIDKQGMTGKKVEYHSIPFHIKVWCISL